jgi:hypothetical protein
MLAFLLAACGSSGAPAPGPDAGVPTEGGAVSSDGPGAPDASVAEAGSPDASTLEAGPADAGTARDGAAATAVHFVLRNETAQTIYIQDQAFWSLSRNGQALRAEDTCEYCNCGGPGCAVCGKALDVAVAIAPGATRAWDWSGFDWALHPMVSPGLNLECEQPEAVGPGPLQVRVTYSLSKVDMPPESRIGPAVVLNVDFQHPPPAEVVLVVR